ncbi:alpha-L-rhamnosidase N-terminal domain-containing protein [Cohnella faecalis]|uniref:Bacterial alpha-L-rhamnosidase N-terminal domain-containing protein n=1 Tax=Cohnella faecalis TaxID=2315694 RepID=A0A398CSY4_9BACL|nr:hypothetical protein D3H35_09980 [Cohnella faecalis]
MEQQSNWHGRWIWKAPSPRAGEGEHETVYFRRTFEVGSTGNCRLLARVSADSRYRLYLNGKSRRRRPLQGRSVHALFRVCRFIGHLVQGSNVLAAQVLHYAVSEPSASAPAVPHPSGGRNRVFIFDGSIQYDNGNETINLHSDENWRYSEDRQFVSSRRIGNALCRGPERVDGSLLPFRWQTAGFDDSGWKKAVVVSEVMMMNVRQLTPWTLTPRPIPDLRNSQRLRTGDAQDRGTKRARVSDVLA